MKRNRTSILALTQERTVLLAVGNLALGKTSRIAFLITSSCIQSFNKYEKCIKYQTLQLLLMMYL